jgi:hypothetical protein
MQSPRLETAHASPNSIATSPTQPSSAESGRPVSSAEKKPISAAATLASAPLKVHARERTELDGAKAPKANQSSTLTGVVTPAATDQLFSPLAMVVIGLLLLAVAASLTALFVQRFRRPPEASFITQSIERQ